VVLRVEEYTSTRASTVVTVAGNADPAGTHRLARLLDGMCLEPPVALRLDLRALDPDCYPALVVVALAVADLERSHCCLEILAPEDALRYLRQLTGTPAPEVDTRAD
jgi:hypothetical protein